MAANPASAGRLLRLIRSGEAPTRAELQRATGLSRSTVGLRLDQLFRAGWIREVAGTSTGGRPSARLEFDDRHAVVLAADLETRHGRAAVLDLAGNLLAEKTGPLVIGDGPEPVLEEVCRWFGPLLAEAGESAARVCGIGLSVPGPVDVAAGRVVEPPIMPGWDGYPITGHLRRTFAARLGGAPDVPVFVDNDANLMAYGEQRAGFPGCAAFLLVKASTGIGAGVVVDGGVYRGIDGGAGDIGHIRLHDSREALCSCGSYGCLAAVASGHALAARLDRLGVPATSGSDVRDLLAAGHPEAVRLAREAGQRVGEVLVTVVTLLNPGVLMIAGELSSVPFLTGVRELLYRRAMPRTTAHLDVVTARLGDRSALVGAAAMAVDGLYAPDRADARLAAAVAAAPGAAGPGGEAGDTAARHPG
ncbi:ROK family protein [Streptomyces sp. NPDC004134]|uniref:ROK family transcriptional regulator n=1 Tax=Streptomyces sp. NPDC004134 TaxID=3364691 RepID=UPI0036A9C385